MLDVFIVVICSLYEMYICKYSRLVRLYSAKERDVAKW